MLAVNQQRGWASKPRLRSSSPQAISHEEERSTTRSVQNRKAWVSSLDEPAEGSPPARALPYLLHEAVGMLGSRQQEVWSPTSLGNCPSSQLRQLGASSDQEDSDSDDGRISAKFLAGRHQERWKVRLKNSKLRRGTRGSPSAGPPVDLLGWRDNNTGDSDDESASTTASGGSLGMCSNSTPDTSVQLRKNAVRMDPPPMAAPVSTWHPRDVRRTLDTYVWTQAVVALAVLYGAYVAFVNTAFDFSNL